MTEETTSEELEPVVDEGAESEISEETTDDTGDAAQEDSESSEGEESSEDEDQDSESAADKKAEVAAKPKRSVQDRIKKAVYNQRRAEREAADLRRQLAERDRVLTTSQSGTTSTIKAPDPKDFEAAGGEFSDGYRKAYDDYVVARAKHEARAEIEASRYEEAAARKAKTLAQRANAVEARGVEKYDDFNDVVEDAFSAFKLDPIAAEALVELDNAEDVTYYLASRPEELEQVSAKSPAAQAVHFGRLSARLSARHQAAEKKITKAQPVPAQARGASGKFESSPDAVYEKLLRELK